MNVFRHLLRCAALLLLPVSVFAAPVVNTASPLAKATLGSVYSQTFTATGGTAPYAWLVTGGALPAGLTLSPEGLLAGTPTATGVFNFTVQVSDAVPEVAAKSFTLTVYLTTAGNGVGIPYPTSITTYPVTDGANTIQVPEDMVYVPAGAFTYGSGTTAASVTLDGYCINKFEVTNAEWKAFLNATGSTQYPTHWSGGTYPTGKANHPVLYVSLSRALAYAAWVSAGTGGT